MVSWFIPEIGNVIDGGKNAVDIYQLLRRKRYLSLRALRNRDHVIAIIEKTDAEFPTIPMAGQERWRDILNALVRAGYVNFWGRTWGMRAQNRFGTTAQAKRNQAAGTCAILDEDPRGPLISIQFAGTYPAGSAGNELAHDIVEFVRSTVDELQPRAVVLDLRSLEYKTGDAIGSVAMALVKREGEFWPTTIVADGMTAKALTPLLEPNFAFGAAGMKLFATREEAIAYLHQAVDSASGSAQP